MIESLDHLVLTVRDMDASIAFYAGHLGMRIETWGAGRVSLHFGAQKINLHPEANDIALVAERPLAGSADLCFLSATPLAEIAARLRAAGLALLAGPVERTGAEGPILSIYLRDPDGNLVEIANRL